MKRKNRNANNNTNNNHTLDKMKKKKREKKLEQYDCKRIWNKSSLFLDGFSVCAFFYVVVVFFAVLFKVFYDDCCLNLEYFFVVVLLHASNIVRYLYLCRMKIILFECLYTECVAVATTTKTHWMPVCHSILLTT